MKKLSFPKSKIKVLLLEKLDKSARDLFEKNSNKRTMDILNKQSNKSSKDSEKTEEKDQKK